MYYGLICDVIILKFRSTYMTSLESGEKMQMVVDSLRSNPDVVIVGGFEHNRLRDGFSQNLAVAGAVH